MKRAGIFLIAAVMSVFVLSSCRTISGIEPELPEAQQVPEYFNCVYEMFRIPVNVFQSFEWPTETVRAAESNEQMFQAIEAARELLLHYSVAHYGTAINTSYNLYYFLAEHFSSETAEIEISFLDAVGNNIAIFYTVDENYFLIMYIQRLPTILANLTWSTIPGDGVARIIPLNAVKAELMALFDRYRYVSYNLQPRSRDYTLQREIEATAQFRAIGVALPQADQTIAWLRDPGARHIAYAMNWNILDEPAARTMGETMVSAGLLRGDASYGFSFQNVPHPTILDGFIAHPTSQGRDAFERHLARILSDNY